MEHHCHDRLNHERTPQRHLLFERYRCMQRCQDAFGHLRRRQWLRAITRESSARSDRCNPLLKFFSEFPGALFVCSCYITTNRSCHPTTSRPTRISPGLQRQMGAMITLYYRPQEELTEQHALNWENETKLTAHAYALAALQQQVAALKVVVIVGGVAILMLEQRH